MVVVLTVSVAVCSSLTVLLVQESTILLALLSGVVLLVVLLLLLVRLRILVVVSLGLQSRLLLLGHHLEVLTRNLSVLVLVKLNLTALEVLHHTTPYRT